MSYYPNLLNPIDVGPFVLPNRAIMGSMHTGLEDLPDGMRRLAAFYQERTLGGVGLIVTGGVSPNKAGRFDENSATLETEQQASKHVIITDTVRREGGRILLQILHTGRYGYHSKIVAPSPIQAPINSLVPRELNEEDILRTIDEYVNTAKLAQLAGYDGVEIMGSEGYLINQFIANLTNKRHDMWGGTFKNRIRFALEIVSKIRKATGNKFCIMFRLSMLDLIDQSSTWDENITLAKAIEKAGANIINTGIGWHESRIPTIAQAVPRGGFAWVTAKMMEHVSVPLVATNRINTPEVAEKIISEKEANLVSMARPFLADAYFLKKAMNGYGNKINNCIACNQACLDYIFEGKSATCMVNPRAGNETRLNWIHSSKTKKMAVIGCGPAGMAAASVAAERGHNVTVYEAANQIGGQFNLAKNVPGKEEFNETLRYFTHLFESHNVKLRLNTIVDENIISNEKFDEVILATGIQPRIPKIQGIKHPAVCGYTEVLAGIKSIGPSIVIIGGGGIAFDTALYILEKQHKSHLTAKKFKESWGIDNPTIQPVPTHQITMLQRSQYRMGKNLGKTTGWVHREILKRNQVRLMSGVQYLQINDAGLHIFYNEERVVIKADNIIICAGQLSNNKLANRLEKLGIPVHKIGGAKNANQLDARRAFDEGTRLAAIL